MADILLTGGRGFVGTNLGRELRERGHRVWTVDVQHAASPMDMRADVTYIPQLTRVFEKHQFEFVYHMAAEYGRWNGEDYYDKLWRTNVIGTKNMLRLQQKYGFRMIFFSSSEVYGDYEGLMTEDVMDTVAIKQLNDYAITKWVGEMQCLNHASMYDSKCVRVRPGNLYGPHEYYSPYRGAVPVMVYKSLRGEPFSVYGSHHGSTNLRSTTTRSTHRGWLVARNATNEPTVGDFTSGAVSETTPNPTATNFSFRALSLSREITFAQTPRTPILLT